MPDALPDSQPALLLAALGADGEYRSRRTEFIRDARGAEVARLCLVPRLLVARTLAAQRRATPPRAAERAGLLARAAEIFTGDDLGGLDFTEYVALTARTAGLPAAVAQSGAEAVADGLRDAPAAVAAARPMGVAADWRDQRAGGVWVRRGEVLAVLAPGNAPGVHGAWPQALALGYRVAVRPSRRDPFTPHRVVLALRRAGFAATDAVVLPTDHGGADDVVAEADLAMVYGGAEVAHRYRGDPTVLVNGPGRTKVLLTAEQDWRAHLDVLVNSIAALAGMACVNATAVLIEGDPAPLAAALAERLDALAPEELPTATTERAQAIAAHVARAAVGATAVRGAADVVADLGDGWAALRPAVHVLARPDRAVLDVELPFPCVWLAPWSRADGVEPLRGSLVLGALTDDDALIDALLAEPSIGNVYCGAVPTHFTAPDVPHDGYLADFLMRSKGFARAIG